MAEVSTCQFFNCDKETVYADAEDPTAPWGLCLTHRLQVGDALGREANRLRVEPAPLSRGEIHIVPK